MGRRRAPHRTGITPSKRPFEADPSRSMTDRVGHLCWSSAPFHTCRPVRRGCRRGGQSVHHARLPARADPGRRQRPPAGQGHPVWLRAGQGGPVRRCRALRRRHRSTADTGAAAGRRPSRAITPDQVAGELAGIVADLYRRLSCHRVAIKLVDRCAPELPDLAQVWFGTARTAQVGAMQEYLTRRHDTGTLTLPGPVDLVARTVVELCALWAVHCHFDPAPTPPGVPPGASPFDDATVAATLAAFITRATTPRPAARSETPA